MSTTEKEPLHIKSYHSERANKRVIKEIIEYCISIFNSAVDEDFLNSQNIRVEFFNEENGITVYEKFCTLYEQI